MSKIFRILVIGAGQIGSRHIQALASIPDVGQVVVVDPSSESRERAIQRWQNVPGHESKRLSLLSAINQAEGNNFDLAVLATNAPGRLDQLRHIVALGIRHVLAEKLLFQSVVDLEDALSLCRTEGVSLYPNYVYRYAAPWRLLRDRLKGQTFDMRVVAGDIGLATNLPHWLDLFEFVGGSPLSELSIKLSRAPYPSKRGGGLLEFSGSATGQTISGASLSLSFVDGVGVPVATIVTADGNWILDEGNCTISGSLAESGMHLEMPMVSRITTLAVPDILAGETILPDLFETASMNRMLLDSVGRALYETVAPDKIIPIT
jgi:predicted dehydrogenase